MNSMAGDNLVRNLAYWAKVMPQKPAIVVDDRPLSYAQLEKSSDEIACGLAGIGVQQGDRIGLLMQNRVEFAEAMYGVLKAGATIVLLNIRYTRKEIQHPVTDAALTAIIADPEFLPLLADLAEYSPRTRVYTADRTGELPALDDLRINGGRKPDIDIDGADIALVSYTSGTTGIPKGAMISHAAICAAGAARTYTVAHSFKERMLIPMPLAYTAGSVFFMRDGVNAGCTIYYLTKPTGDAMLSLIERHRITSVQGVTVLFENMMNSPHFATADLSSLTYAQTGGAMVTKHLLQTWLDRGIPIVQGYGQTESAGSHISLLGTEDAARKMGTAGRPMPNLDVIIVDENGNPLPANEPGEIWVRGSSIMSGYLNRPEETEKALAGGWLHTGDIGILDEEGFLKIVDRTKDMLISGGLNVYPAEIEKAIGGLSGLEDFCVIGTEDSQWGEVPLIVTADASAVDINTLCELCAHQLADYKRPKYIIGHGAPLPRTMSGKITKQELRALYGKPGGAARLKYEKQASS